MNHDELGHEPTLEGLALVSRLLVLVAESDK